MDKIAVFSVIFPGNMPYFKSFLDSLVLQTEKNFDLILLVDNVPDLEMHLKNYRDNLNILQQQATGTIANVRELGLRWLLSLPYAYIIFADTDDLLSADRVAVCRHYLETYPLVVNDLSPFSNLATPNNQIGYWNRRMEHEQVFSNQQIERSNFVGLGNTAVHRKILKPALFPKELHVVDWFLFYQWLQDVEGIFVHTGKVLYRQYSQNLAGFRSVTKERLIYIFETKILHYKLLAPEYTSLSLSLKDTMRNLQKIQRDVFSVDDLLIKLNNRDINYFWWEETEYLYE